MVLVSGSELNVGHNNYWVWAWGENEMLNKLALKIKSQKSKKQIQKGRQYKEKSKG